MADNQFTTHTELFDLRGKYALVTGGTRGIGMMIARGLLQAGARVVISSRNADTCAEAQRLLSEFGDVRAIPADLSRHDECQRLADLVQADSERLDILVNNAGAMRSEPLETFPDEAWDAALDLNLKSPFWLVQALLPALRKAGTADDPARIINIGSIAAIHVAEAPTYSYASSKAALHQLTRVLARELGPQHVTVNAVAPGVFPSQMMGATLDAIGDKIAAAAPLRYRPRRRHGGYRRVSRQPGWVLPHGRHHPDRWRHRDDCNRYSSRHGPLTSTAERAYGRGMATMDPRTEIREFLSSRRARIAPEQAGLPAYGGNRRVKGLRREEVALLAGVSVDYYVRMERGSLAGASDGVLDALASALQLDEAERDHLFHLARQSRAPRSPRLRRPAVTVRSTLQQVLDAISDAAKPGSVTAVMTCSP